MFGIAARAAAQAPIAQTAPAGDLPPVPPPPPAPLVQRPGEMSVAEVALAPVAPRAEDVDACWDERDGPRSSDADELPTCTRSDLELAELYVLGTGWGIAAGLSVAAALDLFDDSAFFGLTALTTAAAVVGIHAVDSVTGELPPGVPSAIGTGLLLGYFETLLIAAASGVDDESLLLYPLGGSLAGAVALGVGGYLMRPEQGDSSLLRSGGLWGLFFSAMVTLATEPSDADDPAVPLLGFNGGVLVAALATQLSDFTRRHVLAIDAGGMAGAFAGFLFSGPAAREEQTIATVVSLTTVVGMVLGAVLGDTRDPEPLPSVPPGAAPMTPYASPTADGRGVVAGAHGAI